MIHFLLIQLVKRRFILHVDRSSWASRYKEQPNLRQLLACCILGLHWAPFALVHAMVFLFSFLLWNNKERQYTCCYNATSCPAMTSTWSNMNGQFIPIQSCHQWHLVFRFLGDFTMDAYCSFLRTCKILEKSSWSRVCFSPLKKFCMCGTLRTFLEDCRSDSD